MATKPHRASAARLPRPLLSLVHIAQRNDWELHANGGNFTVLLTGTWHQYPVTYVWNRKDRYLQVTGDFELRVPQGRHDELHRLAELHNESSSQFAQCEYFPNEGLMALAIGYSRPEEQFDLELIERSLDVMRVLLDELFVAVNRLIWAECTPEQALDERAACATRQRH